MKLFDQTPTRMSKTISPVLLVDGEIFLNFSRCMRMRSLRFFEIHVLVHSGVNLEELKKKVSQPTLDPIYHEEENGKFPSISTSLNPEYHFVLSFSDLVLNFAISNKLEHTSLNFKKPGELNDEDLKRLNSVATSPHFNSQELIISLDFDDTVVHFDEDHGYFFNKHLFDFLKSCDWIKNANVRFVCTTARGSPLSEDEYFCRHDDPIENLQGSALSILHAIKLLRKLRKLGITSQEEMYVFHAGCDGKPEGKGEFLARHFPGKRIFHFDDNHFIVSHIEKMREENRSPYLYAVSVFSPVTSFECAVNQWRHELKDYNLCMRM